MKEARHRSFQYQYVQKQKKEHRCILAVRVVLLLAFLGIWEFTSCRGMIDSFIFSSPTEIVNCFLRMAEDQSIFRHIWVTLSETLISFALSVALGLFVAMILWAMKGVAGVMEPFLVVLNSLPKSALAPLLIVWLGANTRTIIVVGVSLAVFATILNLYTGFQEVDQEQIKLIYTLGGNSRQVLTKVIVPSTIPLLVSIMKVNIGLSLVGVVIGEFLAADEGLGYLIIYGSQVFQLNLVMMSILVLCVIAFGLYQGIAFLEKRMKK